MKSAERKGRGPLPWVLAATLALSGCVPLAGGWSPEVLSSLDPPVALPEGQRLGDTPPYFWPRGEEAWLFLCRFDTREAISVALPDNASAEERRDLELAMVSWERAGLNVRFREAAREERAQIVVLYDDSRGPAAASIAGTGLTVTDCRVGESSGSGPRPPAVVDARLVRATIFLRRSNPDTLGREVPISDDERLGAALHEFGHALGFAGHVGAGPSIMTTTTERIRAVAKRVRGGEVLFAPSLVALYAVPNGTVVGSAALAPQAGEELAAARRIAEARGWRGPFVRVGERNAQLHYRDDVAMAGRLEIVDYAQRLRSGEPLEFNRTALTRWIRSPARSGSF